MSSVYSDYQGIGSVVAAQLAVDDFSAKMGVPIEIVYADHQNKSDQSVSAIARRWIDEDHVDAIMDLPNSVALAVLVVCEAKNKAVIGSGAGSSVLTGPKCSRNFVHWTHDTYAWGAGLGKVEWKPAAKNGSSSPRLCLRQGLKQLRRRYSRGRTLSGRSVTCSTPPISRPSSSRAPEFCRCGGPANAGGDTSTSKQAHMNWPAPAGAEACDPDAERDQHPLAWPRNRSGGDDLHRLLPT